jgi:hypothetical protein
MNTCFINDVGMALRVASRYISGSSQIERGIKVEKEHQDVYTLFEKYLKEKGVKMPISKDNFFKMIAKAHLKELSDYYTRLEKMESDTYKNAMDFTSINPLLKTEKVLNNEELTRAIRLSISAEQDAVSLYETIADSTNDLKVKEVMKSVANEEKVHIGEFQKILSVLDTNELNAIEEGKKEVERKIINK